MFAEEKPALLPLPLEPFRYYQYGERTVHLDGCVEVEAAYYSAPPGWIGRRVRCSGMAVTCACSIPHTGQLLREHLRQQRGRHRIQDEDRPQRTPLGTAQLLARAEKAGAHIGALLPDDAPARRRGRRPPHPGRAVAGQEVRRGAAWTMPAPPRWKLDAYDYRFVRRYLERQPAPPLSLRQVDPLIRQLTLYRDLIDRTKPRRTNQ